MINKYAMTEKTNQDVFFTDLIKVKVNTGLENVVNPQKNLLVYKINKEIISELTIYTTGFNQKEKEPAIILQAMPNDILGLTILNLLYTTMNIPETKEEIPNSFQNNEVREVIYFLYSGIDIFEEREKNESTEN